VLDLYATSVDYDPKTPESLEFFKIVQNKIHFAAHGHTAAEVAARRANAELPFMGLTVFSGEQPVKDEIGIAKNYLTEEELATLNRMVSAFFDLAELRAMRHQPMYMRDWVVELDDFAKRYGKGILPDGGTVSHQAALEKAVAENALIADVETWMDFHKARNSTSHEYGGSIAENVHEKAREFLPYAKDVVSKLEHMV
jgi:hypothetical protein